MQERVLIPPAHYLYFSRLEDNKVQLYDDFKQSNYNCPVALVCKNLKKEEPRLVCQNWATLSSGEV